jgi:chitinase
VLSNGGCQATRDIQNNKTDLQNFLAAGGHVKASFGGASGTYLENACPDAASLATAITNFVNETGITDLDFDVEQGPAETADVNAKRAAALKQVQTQKGIKVAFTVPSLPTDPNGNPGGMSAATIGVIKAAVNAGVTISHVNLMTMDFGDFFSNGKKMGDLTVSAVNDAVPQLQAILPGLSKSQALAMLGATPMIGVNDVSSEVFNLTDAQTVVSFAKQSGLGLVSFWAINRDQPGSNLALASEINTSDFQFHNVFKALQ